MNLYRRRSKSRSKGLYWIE